MKRIALRLSKRMAPADGQDPHPSVDCIGGHDAQHVGV